MARSLNDTLNAEAPAWLQASLFGILAATAVASLLSALLFLVPGAPADRSLQIAIGSGLVALAVYVRWATPRIHALGQYAEMLAAARDEPLAAVRARVWGTGGPGLKVARFSLLLSVLFLAVPVTLLWVVSSLRGIQEDLGEQAGSNVGGLPLLVLAIVLALVIVWVAFRVSRRDDIQRLIESAAVADDPRTLIARAVEMTPERYARSRGSWMGSTLFYMWGFASVFGRISDALRLEPPLSVILWLAVSVPAVALAIRGARRAGAPTAIWAGVAIWSFLGTAIGAMFYVGIWDAFGPTLAEVDADGFPTPSEFVRQLGLRVAMDAPLVLVAWLSATRTRVVEEAVA